MSDASALMGVLRVQPGARSAQAALSLCRPVLHGAWLRQWLGGTAVDQVPGRVGALFALCGSAQADTARRALAVAMADAADLDGLAQAEGPQPPEMAQRLRLATVREHLQRFWLDGAGGSGGGLAEEAGAVRTGPRTEAHSGADAAAPASAAGAVATAAAYPGLPLELLAASPLPRLQPGLSGAAADAALRGAADWIDRHWLGQPGALAATLAAFDGQGSGALNGLDGIEALEASWQALIAAHPGTAGATWLRALLAQKPLLRGLAGADPAAVMLRPDGPEVLARIAGQLRAHDDFAQRPHDAGQARECGPWLRLGDGKARQRPLDAWTRLVMRWVDLARLLSPTHECGAAWLRSGALRTGPDEGLAWTEMARGVLLHWVSLAPALPGEPRRVRDFRVLAPTEWHVHPQGALAQALCLANPVSLPLSVPQNLVRTARRLVAVFDPCVPVEALHA